MSVHLEAMHNWPGAAFRRCTDDLSYVGSRWLKRYKLRSTSGSIFLTWKPNDSSQTFFTRFDVLSDLDCDFVLGKKCTDDDFNSGEVEEPFDHPINGTPICTIEKGVTDFL